MGPGNLTSVLKALADPGIAEHSQRFFKTGKGEYGEGDRFLGIRVPVLRKQAVQFQHMPLNGIKYLLQSPYHEVRLCALFILVKQFNEGGETQKKEIYRLYMNNLDRINNWDLVDSSAPYIVGPFLHEKDRQPLYRLAKSRNLWRRRIAVMSTFYFIRNNDFEDTLNISTLLIRDREDLIHKAVGWMLREVGKRSMSAETSFLKMHYRDMPRTMLRYAIEKFPQGKRRAYLRGGV